MSFSVRFFPISLRFDWLCQTNKNKERRERSLRISSYWWRLSDVSTSFGFYVRIDHDTGERSSAFDNFSCYSDANVRCRIFSTRPHCRNTSDVTASIKRYPLKWNSVCIATVTQRWTSKANRKPISAPIYRMVSETSAVWCSWEWFFRVEFTVDEWDTGSKRWIIVINIDRTDFDKYCFKTILPSCLSGLSVHEKKKLKIEYHCCTPRQFRCPSEASVVCIRTIDIIKYTERNSWWFFSRWK